MDSATDALTATIMAGIPAHNMSLYRKIRFQVGDPVALLETVEGGRRQTTLILRDIEMDRARAHARADRIACPADFAPQGGLSGDRETATAQAAAESMPPPYARPAPASERTGRHEQAR